MRIERIERMKPIVSHRDELVAQGSWTDEELPREAWVPEAVPQSFLSHCAVNSLCAGIDPLNPANPFDSHTLGDQLCVRSECDAAPDS
jgi:hypothetical protein